MQNGMLKFEIYGKITVWLEVYYRIMRLNSMNEFT
jgi:hypothetical protein